MAKLPTVEQMKFRRYPPLKSGPPILWPNHRYFRRNEGSTDYATIPTASPDRIVMDVLPASGGLGLPTGAPAVTDNVLQTIDFAYSGSISELYRNGSDHFAGVIANVKMYTGGTLIRDYPLNDNSNIFANRAASLGQELYSFNGLSGWSATRDDSTLSVNGENVRVTADSTGAHGGKWQLDGLTIGSQLMVNIELLRGTSDGQIRIRAESTAALSGGELVSYVNPNDGSITAIIEVTASTMYFGTVSTGHAAGQYHDINILSIRQADGYGTIINGNADDWGLFDKQANGDWLGQELWDVDNVVFFSSQEQSEINGSSYRVATSDGTGTGVQSNTYSLSGGNTYQGSINVTGSIVGNLNASDFTGFIVNNTGINEFEISPTSDRNVYFKRQQGVTDISFDNVSVKEVLKNA